MNKMISLYDYLSVLNQIATHVVVTDGLGHAMDCNQAISDSIELMCSTCDAGKKIMFIGNGGSSAICSHMAIDASKNGRLRSMAFNDGAALTCLGNDFGYEHVFSEQLTIHANDGDLLVVISSSGNSLNLLRAVAEAEQMGCQILTFSGFREDNPLRKTGLMNWYVASDEYGFVEITHLTLCHAILDFKMGWSKVD